MAGLIHSSSFRSKKVRAKCIITAPIKTGFAGFLFGAEQGNFLPCGEDLKSFSHIYERLLREEMGKLYCSCKEKDSSPAHKNRRRLYSLLEPFLKRKQPKNEVLCASQSLGAPRLRPPYGSCTPFAFLRRNAQGLAKLHVFASPLADSGDFGGLPRPAFLFPACAGSASAGIFLKNAPQEYFHFLKSSTTKKIRSRACFCRLIFCSNGKAGRGSCNYYITSVICTILITWG